MLNPNFDILAAVLALIGAMSYAWVTFRGKAQPNRVSWLLWAVTPSISFAIELSQHVKFEVTLITLSEAIGPLFVLIASFSNSKSYWKINKFDWACGIVSAIAVICWLAASQPLVALVFSLVASLFSAVPTIVKSYTDPATESPWDYLASLVAGIITLLTITQWNLANYGFPVYITVESFVIALLVLTPQRVKKPIVIEPVNVSEGNAMPPAPLGVHTPPVLGSPTWSQNPVNEGSKTVLSVPITYVADSVSRAEYIGSIDPGPGNGFSMSVSGNLCSASFTAIVPSGTYPIAVRIKDAKGTWSELQSTELRVIKV